MIAGAAWLTVAFAAAMALRHGGAATATVIAAVISTLFSMHMSPAAIGLVALFIAGVLEERNGRWQFASVTSHARSVSPPIWCCTSG